MMGEPLYKTILGMDTTDSNTKTKQTKNQQKNKKRESEGERKEKIETEKARVVLERIGTNQVGGIRNASSQGGGDDPVPSISRGMMTRSASNASMSSIETTDSVAASIAGQKRNWRDREEDNSGSDVIEVEMDDPDAKKSRSKTDPELEYYNIRDTKGRFNIDPKETRKQYLKLNALREAERAAQDPDFQISDRRIKKSKARKQELIEVYIDQTTDDLTSAVDEGVGLIEKLAHTANNLKGTTVKALYEATAKITAATTILVERVANTAGSGELDEMRAEMSALRKEVETLKKGLQSTKEENKKLRAARIIESPDRERNRLRGRIDSDHESDKETCEPSRTREVTRERIGEQSSYLLKHTVEGPLPPVFRPPLTGVAARNLDDGSLGPPRRMGENDRGGHTNPSDIRSIILTVLRELGVTAKGGNDKTVKGGETQNPASRKGRPGKKEKGRMRKGCGESGASVGGAPPGVPPGVLSSVPPQSTQTEGVDGGRQSRTEEAWTTVVSRGARRKAAPRQKENKGMVGPVKGRGSASQTNGNKSKNGPKRTTPKIGKPPRMPAVVISGPPGGYNEIMREAKSKIDLQALGIEELRPRKAVTGAMILEIPGDGEGVKADALAGKLSEALAYKEGVKITRPYRKVDLRVRDLDETVNAEEIADAVATLGDCNKDLVRVGEIRWATNGLGLGTAWVQCPLTAARKITAQRRIKIGWLSYRVEVLPPRQMQCYRCLEVGHTSARCQSKTDRSRCCYRCGQEGHRSSECDLPLACPACNEKGKKADHKIGSKGCGATIGRKKTGGSGAVTRNEGRKGGDDKALRKSSSSDVRTPPAVQGTSISDMETEAPRERRTPRAAQDSEGGNDIPIPMEHSPEEANSDTQCP